MQPLYTPLFLSQALLLRAGLTPESEGILQTVAGLSLGGRLGAFTALHLVVFGVGGLLAATTADLLNLRWNARYGALAGLGIGILAWLAGSQAGLLGIGAVRLTREIVVGAGVVGGAVYGWYLKMCRMDAEEDG